MPSTPEASTPEASTPAPAPPMEVRLDLLPSDVAQMMRIRMEEQALLDALARMGEAQLAAEASLAREQHEIEARAIHAQLELERRTVRAREVQEMADLAFHEVGAAQLEQLQARLATIATEFEALRRGIEAAIDALSTAHKTCVASTRNEQHVLTKEREAQHHETERGLKQQIAASQEPARALRTQLLSIRTQQLQGFQAQQQQLVHRIAARLGIDPATIVGIDAESGQLLVRVSSAAPGQPPK